MKSTLWRDSRRRQEYRNLSQHFDSGLYALAQLSVNAENNIEVPVDEEQVRQDIQYCVALLKHLRLVADDPAQGAIEEVNLVDAEDLTSQELQLIIDSLTLASLTQTPPEDDTRERLKSMEQYAKRKAEQHTRF